MPQVFSAPNRAEALLGHTVSHLVGGNALGVRPFENRLQGLSDPVHASEQLLRIEASCRRAGPRGPAVWMLRLSLTGAPVAWVRCGLAFSVIAWLLQGHIDSSGTDASDPTLSRLAVGDQTVWKGQRQAGQADPRITLQKLPRLKVGSLSARTSALTLPNVVSGLCLMPS
jgi:hypothetical protein